MAVSHMFVAYNFIQIGPQSAGPKIYQKYIQIYQRYIQGKCKIPSGRWPGPARAMPGAAHGPDRDRAAPGLAGRGRPCFVFILDMLDLFLQTST